VETIVTDQSWKASDGPVLMNSIYLGETYDARLEQKGWDIPGFNDNKWAAASVVNGPAGKLTAQDIPPIRITKILKPVKITEPTPGVYLFDFGQVFAGVPRLKVKDQSGATITLRSGEDVHADGTLNFLTVITGQLKAMWNLRGGPGCPDNPINIITYTAKGDAEEIYTPEFTFSSFRYVEMTGLKGKPTLEMLEGLRMNTDLEETGKFECSNEMFNRLHDVTRWTFLSNVFSIQSDCPAREKFGYGADIVATAEAYCYDYDMSRFYRKIAQDFANDVRPKGGMPEIAPYNGLAIKGIGDQSGPLGWQLAFPYCVKQVYDFYGDKPFLEKNYDILKRQVEFIRSVFPNHIVPQDISDHESIDAKPEAFTATSFYLQHVNILVEWAEILQKQTDITTYKNLAEDIRMAALKEFGRGNGIFDNGTQAAQLFALYHNIVPEHEKVPAIKHLLEEIYYKHKGHLSTGIFATKYIFDISRLLNRNDVAYSVVNQRTFPGYGYMLDHGATTLWESWEYPDTVNSQNHPMFGSVVEWYYRSLLGINSLTPGFKTFYIKPQPAGDLYWARGHYDSQSGRIVSEWNTESTTFRMRVGIPANTTALVYVPSLPGLPVKESGGDAKTAPGLQFKEYRDGYAVFEAGSGTYNFKSIFQKQ
jgi:alpha-L-rhamnosidase